MKRRPETGGAGTRSANGFSGPRLADDDSALVALFIIGVLLVATFGGLIAWAAISLVIP